MDRSSTLENVRSEIVQLSNLGNDDDGYFIHEKPVQLLCDSGANVTTLNSSLLNTWGNKLGPCLTPVNSMLFTVTGESKPFKGKAVVGIRLGKGTSMQRSFIH